jgi:hypothetical protein
MNVALFGSGKAKRAYRTLEARVLADGGIIQSPEATLEYYTFMYRTFGYVPRRVYSALAGVKLNDIAGTDYVSKMYDMNPISPIDAEQTIEASQPLWDVDADCSHRIVRFNGTNNYLTVNDLSILQNQPFNSIFAVKNTTYPQVDIGVVFRMMFSTASAKLSLEVTAGNDSLVARRTESDSTASVQTLDTTVGFATNAGVANWAGNSLEFFRDKETLGSATFSSGAGNSDSNLLTRFWIGGANAANRYYNGIVSEFIADRSIYTQAQINALHDFMKQFYPTLS